MVGTSKRGRGVSAKAVAMRKERFVVGANKNESKRNKVSNACEAYHQIDPFMLSRGMTGRVLGARIPELEPLSVDEIQKDLAIIEKYQASRVQYAQQLYIFRNRLQGVTADTGYSSKASKTEGEGNSSSLKHGVGDSLSSKVSGKRSGRASTKVDVEEEKLNQVLRKKISHSEAKREVLESEYVSLRAHYVHEVKKHEATKESSAITLKLLQNLVRSKATVVSLLRARDTFSKEIVRYIAKRNKKKSPQDMNIDNGNNDLVELKRLWTLLECTLKESVLDYERRVESINGSLINSGQQTDLRAGDISEVNDSAMNKPKTRGASSADSIRIKWDALTRGGTPGGLQLQISPLSRAPDRVAGVVLGSLFQNGKTDLIWLENNLPRSLKTLNESNPCELGILKALKEESTELDEKIVQIRKENAEMNRELLNRRRQSDQVCARMALLRTETEAIVMRHNAVLETPEARARGDVLVLEHLSSKESGEGDDSNVDEVASSNQAKLESDINEVDSSNEGDLNLSQDESDEDGQGSTIGATSGIESTNNSDASDTDAENDIGAENNAECSQEDDESIEGEDNRSVEERSQSISGEESSNSRGRTRIQVRLARTSNQDKVNEADESSKDDLFSNGTRQKRDAEFLVTDDSGPSFNKRARRRQS